MSDTASDCSDIEERRHKFRRLSERIDINSEDFEGDGSNDAVLEPRPKLHWTHVTMTLSWADADVVMRDLDCTQCNGYNLRERGGFSTKTGLCYHFQCGFFNFLGCGWQLRVLVPFDQRTEILIY